MSVEAFTVDGKVTIDTTPFESGIAKVTTQLSELSGSMKSMMEMGGGNWNFNGALNGLKTLKDDIAVIKQDIATMNTEFANTQGIETLRSEILELRREIDAIKQKVNETTTQTVQRIREVKTEISAITSGTEPLVQLWTAMNGQLSEHYDILGIYNSEIGQINAKWRETQGLVQKNTAFMKEMEVSGSNVAKYFIHENELLQASLNFINQRAKSERTFDSAVTKSFSSLVRLSEELERQVITTQKRATALSRVGKEIIRNGSEIKKNLTYEEEMVATEKLFQNGLGEELASRIRINEQIKISNEMFMASKNAESQMLTLLNEERGILSNLTGQREKSLAFIKEELTLEKEKASLIGEETALLNEQGAVRQRNATKVNDLDKMGYLPRRIGSMALTMWGFNELMDVYDKTMSHINAESQKDYFAKRMGMNAKATQDFTNQLNGMQKQYKKLDMTVVGANALETATKYKVQQQSLGDLTEVMAIYGSEFVKQGRSQEDSILAINDALDGELRRLKEVGIGAEELKATGLWSGEQSDKEGMLKALLQIAQERGYDKTAKDITNLSDAITTLEVKLSIDLARAFGVIEPLITDVLGNFVTMLEALEKGIGWVTPKITEFAKAIGLIDKDGKATQFGNFLEDWVSWMITFGITAYGVYKIAKPLLGMFGKLKDVGGGIAEGTGDVGKTMNTGGFKENFKSEWGKLGKNLGKMARVFVEFAVALAMAWALIEEAILLISAIGYTYESLKPQFNSGIEFIKEFGIWFALLGGAMLVFSYALGKVPDSAMESIGKGAVKLATGMAIAMGLIAEAIVLLNLPLLAIASIGAVQNWQQENIESGIATIHMFADALNYIASDDTIAWFIVGFVAISGILGLTADVVAIPMVVGIATTLLLVAEAITMLIVPLGAIALLGASASALGEENINQGAETIKLIGNVLQVLAQAIPYLLVVDLTIFGVQLVEWGNRLLSGGKDGLTTLVQDILPTIQTFISDFNDLDFSETLKTEKITAITTVATQLPPLFTAIQKLNNAMGTSDALGNIGGALGGSISGAIGMGLKSKLDQLYNDVKDVMDFATKLGGLSTGNGGNTTAIQQTANAIAQLKVKLNLFITTISSASARVQSASTRLGNALPTGFRTGSASFGSAVVSVLAKGVSEIQSRYATFNNGGKTLGQKMVDGFKNHKPSLKSIVVKEMDYALQELDNRKDDFYYKGQALGKQLSDGFESSGGLNVGSPANIARTIAKEMEYSMLALDSGKQMMYKGGQALGRALTNGYNSYQNLRTDVGVLAQKGVSNEQLQANAKNVQANDKVNQQTPKIFAPTVNIDMSNSTIIGVQDLDARIRQSVDKAMIEYNSPNGAIGY